MLDAEPNLDQFHHVTYLWILSIFRSLQTTSQHLSCDFECCSIGKQDTPPSFSVVASISSEALALTRSATDDLAVTSLSASHRQTSAVTAASGGSSTSPVWNEWLACDFQQEHLATAVLQLNIMSGATSICRYTLACPHITASGVVLCNMVRYMHVVDQCIQSSQTGLSLQCNFGMDCFKHPRSAYCINAEQCPMGMLTRLLMHASYNFCTCACCYTSIWIALVSCKLDMLPFICAKQLLQQCSELCINTPALIQSAHSPGKEHSILALHSTL